MNAFTQLQSPGKTAAFGQDQNAHGQFAQWLRAKSLLSIFCPLITFVPVLAFILVIPAEALITLAAWLISNVVILVLLWSLGRIVRGMQKRPA